MTQQALDWPAELDYFPDYIADDFRCENPKDELYAELGNEKAFRYWAELEAYAKATLTVQQRAAIYLELKDCMGSANGDRLEKMLAFARLTDRAAYRDELWRWMMEGDHVRWDFVEWLFDKAQEPRERGVA